MQADDPHRAGIGNDARITKGKRLFALASVERWNLVLCFLSAFALFLIILQATPRVADTSYRLEGKDQTWQTLYLPLSVSTSASSATLHTSLVLGSPYPSIFVVTSSGCPKNVTLNGMSVPAVSVSCTQSGARLSLSSFVHPGSNALSADVAARSGKVNFKIYAAPDDPLILSLCILLFAILLAGTLLAIRPSVSAGKIPSMILIICSGTILRFFYVLSTTYNVRSYDWSGHAEYIRYILQNLAIPPATGGWQFYHPPLYYLLTALWSSLGWMMGGDAARVVLDAQSFSLVLSLATLGVGCWIGRMLFDKKEDHLSLTLFCALIAFFPAIVYHAARVSNDVLLLLITFLAFALLLRWWRRPNRIDWCLASIVIGLGVLTKNNALPLIPIAWGLAAMRRGFTSRERAKLVGISALILIAVTGLLFLVRPPFHDATLIGNNLNPRLLVSNSFDNLVTFNPWEILTHPYNNTWLDSARRQFFWEFFFRSAFFGEFSMGLIPLAVTLLLSGIFLIPVVIFGFLRSFAARDDDAIPLALTTVILLASILYLRIVSPYSPSQDFRYVPLLVVTLGAYILKSVATLPHLLREFILSCFAVLLFCSLTLLIALTLK